VFSTRDAAERHIETDEQALRLAAELSDRARRESATARALAAMLASQSVSTPAVTNPPVMDRLTVGCTTCDTSLNPSLGDVDEGANQARAFFDRHDECRTFVDLSPVRGGL
jgi:hypothetical protein